MSTFFSIIALIVKITLSLFGSFVLGALGWIGGVKVGEEIDSTVKNIKDTYNPEISMKKSKWWKIKSDVYYNETKNRKATDKEIARYEHKLARQASREAIAAAKAEAKYR